MTEGGQVINIMPLGERVPKLSETDNAESGVDLDTTATSTHGSSASERMKDDSSDLQNRTTDRLLSVSDEENERKSDTVIQADELYDSNSGLETSSGPSSLQKLLKTMRKKEFIICFIGAFALLLGIILVAVSVGIRQCPSLPQADNASESQGNEHHHDHRHHTTSGAENQDYVTGSYVSVIHNADHNVTKDELVVNLAEGKPSTQSSTAQADGHQYYAGLAVDGQSGHRFAMGTCSQTEWEQNPHWFADMGKLQLVKTVKIVIPNDCCAGEMHNFEVRVGQNRDLSLNPLCKLHLGTALKITITIQCDRQLYGRYVSIQVIGDETRRSNRLTLCEVMVYKD